MGKKRYQRLDDTFEFDKTIKKEKLTHKRSNYNGSNRSNLIYDSKYSFYPYYKIENFNIFSVVSKYPILFFFSGFNKFNNINPQKGCTKDKEANAYNNASKLYMKVSANLL